MLPVMQVQFEPVFRSQGMSLPLEGFEGPSISVGAMDDMDCSSATEKMAIWMMLAIRGPDASLSIASVKTPGPN